MFSHSFVVKTIAVSTSIITFIMGRQVVAQVISNISVDPYNDSNVQSVPIGVNTPEVNLPNTGEKTADIQIDTIYIQGSPTPKPPSQLTGQFTSSNQTLPPIPSISEPYSQQAEPNTEMISENEVENTVNVPISVSPFNMTPNDNSAVKTNPKKNTTNLNTSSAQNSLPKSDNNQEPQISITQPHQTRRTLREILVQSQSNYNSSTLAKNNSLETEKNSAVYQVLVKVNNVEEQNKIKALYPEAFPKIIEGDRFLQIGIFSNQDSVQQISQAIAQIGLKAIIK